jgi:hypothetical protein
MYKFDEAKGIYKSLAEFKYCDVLAYVPKEALCPIECGFEKGADNIWRMRRRRLPRYHQDIWSGYISSIAKYEGNWDETDKKLKYHRNNSIPAKMRITLNFDFRPAHVVEYLETK